MTNLGYMGTALIGFGAALASESAVEGIGLIALAFGIALVARG